MEVFKSISKEDVKDKRVVLRLDFNVPLKEQKILDDTRLKAGINSIRYLLDLRPKQIIVLAHVGRPKGYDAALSLAPIVKYLKQQLSSQIKLVSLPEQLSNPSDSEIVCVENIRFYEGEETNSSALVDRLSRLGDVFVNDAFSVMHRMHASTYGISFELPSFIGKNALEELENLDFSDPPHPFIIILGGKKLETKLSVIESLIDKVDRVLIGGAMAFTFLKAKGFEVGKSLIEDSFLGAAERLLSSGKIVLPKDVVCSTSFKGGKSILRDIEGIKDNEIGLDIGPETSKKFALEMKDSRLVFWNGAMGVFEQQRFAQGTKSLIEALKDVKARKIAGGGETIQAIKSFASLGEFDFVSMGGGACLKYISEGSLPCLEPLKRKQ
jgi:phosphoglycerate kinase